MPINSRARKLGMRDSRVTWDEFKTRCAQELAKRRDALQHALGMPFGSPIDGASAGASARFFFDPADIAACVDLIGRQVPDRAASTIQRAKRICAHRFDLLGYQDLDYGGEINWHLDAVHGKQAPLKPWFKIRYLDFRQVGDSKIIWELNRHQHMVLLAKAYRLTGESRFVSELLAQWHHWRRHNPYPLGINWASSLEVAFRSLSWLWVKYLLADCSAVTQAFWRDLDAALALHGRHIRSFLSTYFSPNTHLLGEGVALFFLGVLCSAADAEEWRQTGWEIVLHEAEQQVLPDGMHFEQSTYYHVYALDFLLHARILAARNGVVIPPEFDRVLEKMLEALAALGGTGLLPRFGDDDGGRLFDPQRNRAEDLLDPLATGAVIFGRPDFKYAAGGLREETIWLLGPDGVDKFERLCGPATAIHSTALPSAGIYKLASAGPSVQQMVVDAGPLGNGSGGHGHADLLSLVFMAEGREWLTDPGTFEYVGLERDLWRGTRAHNTLQVDGVSQADPVRPFAWDGLPLAKVDTWLTGRTFTLLAARHNGYSRLREPIEHRRWVFHTQPGLWLVRDRAEGSGVHDFELSWHFAPGIKPESPTEEETQAIGPAGTLAHVAPEGNSWSREIAEGWYSAAYGCKQPIKVLRTRARAAAPVEFACVWVYLHDRSREPRKLERLAGVDPDRLQVYRYSSPGECHYIFFAETGEPWGFQRWTCNARFLYLGLGPEPYNETLVLVDGSYLADGGQPVISLPHSAAQFEYRVEGKPDELLCSELKECGHSLSQWFGGIRSELLSEVAFPAPEGAR
jgi:Heparinase II/III-like protein/Heparinase II/III N-terminus